MEVPRRWLVVLDMSMRGAGCMVSDVSVSARWCWIHLTPVLDGSQAGCMSKLHKHECWMCMSGGCVQASCLSKLCEQVALASCVSKLHKQGCMMSDVSTSARWCWIHLTIVLDDA